jgi:hypothetical protein
MSTRTYSYSIGAGGTAVAPGGRFFYVKSATSSINISTRGTPSSPVDFIGVGAGLKFGPVEADKTWRFLDITSAVAQVVEIVISDDAEVDIASTVNVAGSVMVTDVPSTLVATPARIATNITTDTVLAAANLTRRRVTIQNPSGNSDSVNVGPDGSLSTTRGVELEPGMSFEFATTAAISARAVTGTPSVQVLEES